MTIDSVDAKKIDDFLLDPSEINYEIEQVGASLCIDEYVNSENSTILVLCGSGNNGADGLVIARHLTIMNYNVGVYCPKYKQSELHMTLYHQAIAVGATVIDDVYEAIKAADYIIDAIVGFGFTGSILRDPWKDIMNAIYMGEYKLIAIDVPSGVSVDAEPPTEVINKTCDMLISITIPKKCIGNFTKPHYLCGRFVPSSLLQAKGYPAPEYPRGSVFLRLD